MRTVAQIEELDVGYQFWYVVADEQPREPVETHASLQVQKTLGEETRLLKTVRSSITSVLGQEPHGPLRLKMNQLTQLATFSIRNPAVPYACPEICAVPTCT